jgi:LAS superfamily LD-carboxypeptidase LdcB
MLTLIELKEKLSEQISEFDLVDLLGLTSWDIVNAFEDKLEAKYAQILDELIIEEYEDGEE